MRVKDFPVEALTLEDKVLAFAWEPQGHRFAIIHAETDSPVKSNVSFYTIDSKSISKTDTLEKRQVSRLLWASRGRFIAIYAMPSGVFEFYDAELKDTMAKDKHHEQCTNAQWDPTGRFLTTYVSGWRSKSTELGFKLWSFRGTEITTIPKDGFFQFMWRPRPPSLLTPAQRHELSTQYPTFMKKYKKEDAKKQDDRLHELKKERQQVKEKFYQYMRQNHKEYDSDAAFRKQHGIQDLDSYLVEEEVEEVINEKEEVQ